MSFEQELRQASRNIEIIKNYAIDTYVIKEQNIPESIYLLEQRIAREAGYGNIPITQDFKSRKNLLT